MSSARSLKVYDILNKHFKNDADSKVLIESVEEIIDKKMDESKNILATKQDLNEAITAVKSELLEKIYKAKIETITWIVAVGIIQFILTILSKKFL